MTEPFKLRSAQQKILEYEGGRMGISAVPGSGKTFTLSLLAARLVERLAASGTLDEREVLVVTFTNSAAENFRHRINQFIQQRGLLPGVGYRVRTLHGLAHDIVRDRPGLAGLAESFDIVDERTGDEIVQNGVASYLQSHPDLFGAFLKREFLDNPRRIEQYLYADALEIARSVIRTAKDLRTDAAKLANSISRQSGHWPLLSFALQIFADYQRGLKMRGAVDFNDLIVLALQCLETDGGFLSRLQQQWPYILEDEAQDSSLLQEQMLDLLTQSHGNWVRVGDPNQAINTTFTSANPKYLRRFIADSRVQVRDLPNSGRSAQPIIDLANYLAQWSRTAHPVLSTDMALTEPEILPTDLDDPQPNPEPGAPCVTVFDRALSPEEELNITVGSLLRWLPQNQDRTVAVLAPDNFRGFALAQALKEAGLPFDDSLLRASNNTRITAAALATILLYIIRPEEPTHLDALWRSVWWPRKGVKLSGGDLANAAELPEPVEQFGRALARVHQPERYLFPAGGDDWLDDLGWLDDIPGFRTVVDAFRNDLRRWTAATVLPIDELVLTLGSDIFEQPADLALTHSIAVLLAKRSRERPHLRLPDLARELEDISQNKGRLLGFNEDALGFEPPAGKVTVATMHAAKGLEWDRVYLLAVSAYSFPSGGDEEGYRSERWFVRDSLNLIAECIEQTQHLHMGTLDECIHGQASLRARSELAAERLRLLYVGITRARRELIILYNTGRLHESRPNEPALAFRALAEYLMQQG
jgi:DNA helicase II / ATP-dependent DNA helicase PcrA